MVCGLWFVVCGLLFVVAAPSPLRKSRVCRAIDQKLTVQVVNLDPMYLGPRF